MRLSLQLFSSALCLLLSAGIAQAGEKPGERAITMRSTAGLATRYLPAAERGVTVAALPLEMPTRRAQFSRAYSATPILPGVLELRMRTLGDAKPPDPRQRFSSGVLALRLPVGDSIDVSAGVRLDYSRHPVNDLRTGDPTPTLRVSLRF